MNKLFNVDSIREDDFQSRLDSDFMAYTTAMVRYVLNPQGKLPPKLKENNLWFIFATNLLNLAAKIDFSSGIVTVEKEMVIDTYCEIQKILDVEYKPDNNLCYYPLYIMKTSNSSKFIHGLPYIEILKKWYNEFNQNSEELRDFIETLREKLHIDSNIEIVSARVVGRSIYLRMKNDEFDVTIPLWYSTKRETFTRDSWETIELNDSFGNIFSPQWAESINYYFSDEEIKNSIDIAHEQWAKYMINFFAWRAPEYVTANNYKNYYHNIVEDFMSDEEAIKHYDWVLHHFNDGERVIIKQVNDKNWNFLSSTQDQILPNYWNRKGNEQEQENYKYWKNTYEKELIRLINLWVDSFRIDLAHGFRKNNDCNLLNTLITDIIEYAKKEYDKKIYFILETYDFSNFWGTNPATFRDWNNSLPYPAIKVYHKETEDKLTDVKGYNWLENLIGDLHWLYQDIRGIYGEMMAASTFDDYTLYDIAEKSGIDYKCILEMEMLLGKAGYNILSLDRDFLWEHWEIIPTVPGGREQSYGTGKFSTHSFSSKDEFQVRTDNNSKTIYEKSEAVKILKRISDFPEIKGLTIDKSSKKLMFIFDDNSRRVFDFSDLMNWWQPYTEISKELPKMLLEKDIQNLIKLEELEDELASNLKENVLNNIQLPHVYNYEFWSEFVNYVKLDSWSEKSIEEWDTHKQEAYFLLNRDRLINTFFSYKNIDLLEQNDTENLELSQEINELRKTLEAQVKKIIEKSVKETYPELIG